MVFSFGTDHFRMASVYAIVAFRENNLNTKVAGNGVPCGLDKNRLRPNPPGARRPVEPNAGVFAGVAPG